MNLRTVIAPPARAKLMRERQQIVDVIASTKEELTAARTAQEQRRAQLGELEADAALQTLADPAALTQARTKLRESSESIEHLESRLNALTSKLRTATLALLDLEPAIEAERGELVEKRLSRWREEYRKAAKAFYQVVLAGQALGAIEGKGLDHALQGVHAPDPERIDQNLLHIGTVRRPAEDGGFDAELTWERNEAAVREHQALKSETKSLDEALAVIKELRTQAAAK